MPEVKVDKELVAYCGLYCGACGAYKRGKCPGCHKNEKATWCRIRKHCMEKGYATCADCTDYKDVKECKDYHNFIARIIGFVLRSNRPGCIERIREIGVEAFAREMGEKGRQSMPR